MRIKNKEEVEALAGDVYKEISHEISAFYAGGPGEPYYQPVIECLCGFSSGRSESWEDAGRAYDSHRRDIGEIL